jgi:hypothetical protein
MLVEQAVVSAKNTLPEIRNEANFEMITNHTWLNDRGFTMDLNVFFIDAELHGNLTLRTKNMVPD